MNEHCEFLLEVISFQKYLDKEYSTISPEDIEEKQLQNAWRKEAFTNLYAVVKKAIAEKKSIEIEQRALFQELNKEHVEYEIIKPISVKFYMPSTSYGSGELNLNITSSVKEEGQYLTRVYWSQNFKRELLPNNIYLYSLKISIVE